MTARAIRVTTKYTVTGRPRLGVDYAAEIPGVLEVVDDGSATGRATLRFRSVERGDEWRDWTTRTLPELQRRIEGALEPGWELKIDATVIEADG